VDEMEGNMNNNTIKIIITAFVLIVIIGIALSILKWLLRILLPLAVVAIAVYFIYNLVTKGRQ